jgi:hypothetical protein
VSDQRSVLEPTGLIPSSNSYFVTELLGTDLHRLLTSRPLEKQFIQYFLYQILVRISQAAALSVTAMLILSKAWAQIRPFSRRCASRPGAFTAAKLYIGC